MKAAAVTVGSFPSGSTTNTIPDTATIKGTVRTTIQYLLEEMVKS